MSRRVHALACLRILWDLTRTAQASLANSITSSLNRIDTIVGLHKGTREVEQTWLKGLNRAGIPGDPNS